MRRTSVNIFLALVISNCISVFYVLAGENTKTTPDSIPMAMIAGLSKCEEPKSEDSRAILERWRTNLICIRDGLPYFVFPQEFGEASRLTNVLNTYNAERRLVACRVKTHFNSEPFVLSIDIDWARSKMQLCEVHYKGVKKPEFKSPDDVLEWNDGFPDANVVKMSILTIDISGTPISIMNLNGQFQVVGDQAIWDKTGQTLSEKHFANPQTIRTTRTLQPPPPAQYPIKSDVIPENPIDDTIEW